MQKKENIVVKTFKELLKLREKVVGLTAEAVGATVSAYERQPMGGALTTGHKKNKIIIRDAITNEILLEDWPNLIVLRGRTYALEKLFADPIGASGTNPAYVNNLNRKIALFSIGDGGAPSADPFNPTPPEPLDQALGNRIPFRTVDSRDAATNLSVPEQSMYYQSVVTNLNDGAPYTLTKYYAKTFDVADPEWGLDTANNEVYKKIVLRISDKDARNLGVNEIMLMIAEWTGSTYADIEAYSIITFPTESLLDPTKQLIIEYYVYS
jgi:hypothetical protein